MKKGNKTQEYLKIKIGVSSLVVTLLCSASTSLLAHPGGLDRNGGHTDKRTGLYHCHKTSCTSKERNAQRTTKIDRGTIPKYNRKSWPHWSDFDGDCMNTRHEILLRDEDSGRPRLSPDRCYVSRGQWHDPFSGKTLTRASDLDVDHIVPLKWAHDHGGWKWSKRQKERFANDPLNLIAVDDGLNQQKSAQGPTTWLPPNHHYRCTYINAWDDVLRKYSDLKFTSREYRTFAKLKTACGI